MLTHKKYILLVTEIINLIYVRQNESFTLHMHRYSTILFLCM